MTKIFPVYFSMQTALPVVLALTYPASSTSLAPAGIAGVLDSSNKWSVLVPIASILASGLANLAVVGPATTKCMEQRKLQGECSRVFHDMCLQYLRRFLSHSWESAMPPPHKHFLVQRGQCLTNCITVANVKRPYHQKRKTARRATTPRRIQKRWWR